MLECRNWADFHSFVPTYLTTAREVEVSSSSCSLPLHPSKHNWVSRLETNLNLGEKFCQYRGYDRDLSTYENEQTELER
jgi:hypothetical protein